MKTTLFLTLFFSALLLSCSSLKNGTSTIRYFDIDNQEISRSEFKWKRSTNKFLDIPGDSTNHRKLISREKRGKITNKPVLESFLEKVINRKLDSDKPIVIIYYPGKDMCNSSGTANKKQLKNWYTELESGLSQIAQTQPIYIYKDKEGLQTGDIMTWHKDPKGTIERLFFEHHYPCSSFVVISESGDYISYFGEFPKEYVWEATKILTE